MTLEESLVLNRRIAAGEIPPDEAISMIVQAGAPLDVANRRVSILIGQRRDEPLPDPATLPAGLGL
jgi:hypothetical protein